MSQISVLTLQAGPPVPAGVTRASTTVVVTDNAGAAQTASLTGTEVPAWTAVFTVAPGAGNVVLTDVDTTGATIGSPQTVKYDTGSGTTQLQTSGATITVVLP